MFTSEYYWTLLEECVQLDWEKQTPGRFGKQRFRKRGTPGAGPSAAGPSGAGAAGAGGFPVSPTVRKPHRSALIVADKLIRSDVQQSRTNDSFTSTNAKAIQYP